MHPQQQVSPEQIRAALKLMEDRIDMLAQRARYYEYLANHIPTRENIEPDMFLWAQLPCEAVRGLLTGYAKEAEMEANTLRQNLAGLRQMEAQLSSPILIPRGGRGGVV